MSDTTSPRELDGRGADLPSSPRESHAAPAARRPGLRVSGWVLSLIVSAVIIGWQTNFNVDLPTPHPDDAVTASVGLLSDLRDFFYFYYHLGLFPVGARDVPRLGPSRHDALEFVARHGGRLRMDFGETENTPRYGDYCKLFALLPDAWLRHDPGHASAMPFNQLLFVTGLLSIWWAFWRERRVLLGGLIVVLVGSDPFQLYETYGRANIFALPISAALIALAVHLSYLTGRRGLDRRAWAIALASGAALATIREMRTEGGIIAISLAATYLSMRASWPRRAVLVLVFIAAWWATSHAWTTYWNRNFERSARFVAQAGGRVYPGRHADNHSLWHSLYCGLGDFGGDRGFVWDDREVFRWSTTRDSLTNPHPLPYHYRGGYYFAESYDGVSPIAPTDLPEYNRIVRDRVVSVICTHPLWYARILLQRVGAILGLAMPATLSVGVAQLRLPGVGWLLLPILLLVRLRRRDFEARLILFTLPLSAVALLVYSGRGTTNYGIAHLIALAVAIDLLVRWQRRAGLAARRLPAVGP